MQLLLQCADLNHHRLGETCIQSAYQLVITTVVKKEQKMKLEVKKLLSPNSTLGNKRLFHILPKKGQVNHEEIEK